MALLNRRKLIPVFVALGLLVVAGTIFAVLARDGDSPSRSVYLRGVNSFTLAYASSDPTYRGEPTSSYEFLASRGTDFVRLPFYWGKLQPALGGPLDPRYLAAIEREVRRIEASGMSVVLDLHNSCRWPLNDSKAVCGDGISQRQLTDVWQRLSRRFARDPGVIAYDIMNEPFGMKPEVWETFSQAVVDGLRKRGDNKRLWIEATGYSAVEAFAKRHPQAWIRDPADNIVYSAHQYFDFCGCYTRGFEVSSYTEELDSVMQRLGKFTDWLEDNKVKGSIGEVGWPSARRTSTWSEWNEKGEEWYSAADEAGLSVAHWSATSAYDEENAAYDSPANALDRIPGISVAETQSKVIEKHPGRGAG